MLVLTRKSRLLFAKGRAAKKRNPNAQMITGFLNTANIAIPTPDTARPIQSALTKCFLMPLIPKRMLVTSMPEAAAVSTIPNVFESENESTKGSPNTWNTPMKRDLIPNANDRLIEDALALRIPVIYLNSSAGPYGVVHITPDYREAGKILTDKLKDSGRSKIACIFCSDSSAGMDEYKGYIGAVKTFDEGRCLLISHKEEKEIISGKDKILSSFIGNTLAGCDAVICQNGMIAHCLVSLLNKSGIKVPEEITVACFDNGYYSSNDSILSMGYDNDLLCRKLAKTVSALAEGSTPKMFVIPTAVKG